jgi:hypothetical protein
LLANQIDLFGKNNCFRAEFNVTTNINGTLEITKSAHVARLVTETNWAITVRIIFIVTAAARTFECVRTIIAGNTALTRTFTDIVASF